MANLVQLPIEYYPDPTKGRPVFNGSIYVGIPDTDPEIPGNQKAVVLREEDGTEVPVAQPVNTGAGGVPLYNGSPVQILTDGSYSLKVLDKDGVQVYYVANVDANAVAILDENNTFTGDNTFTGETSFDGTINVGTIAKDGIATTLAVGAAFWNGSFQQDLTRSNNMTISDGGLGGGGVLGRIFNVVFTEAVSTSCIMLITGFDFTNGVANAVPIGSSVLSMTDANNGNFNVKTSATNQPSADSLVFNIIVFDPTDTV